MNRVCEVTRRRASRVGLVAAVIAIVVVGLALPAGANTGHVFTSQTCFTWSASVTLDNNVTTVRFVEVSTTIPGTTGIHDAHYDTTGNVGTMQIWSASGQAPATGTVTLTILNPDRSVDFTASASLATLKDCTPSTTPTVPTTTTTLPPTTTTATLPPPPSTTTTVAPSSTTTAPPSTTVPPAIETTTTIEVSPVTAIESSTTSPPSPTVKEQQTSPPSPTVTQVVSQTGNLPRTGSGAEFPVLFGVCCVGTGAMLTVRRRRRAWTARR